MKRNIIATCLVSLAVVIAGCGRGTPEYKKKLEVTVGSAPALEFKRYEEVLFNLDTAAFQQELMAIQDEFHPFLDGDLGDPLAVKYLKDFALDPFSLMLYHKVKAVYPSLEAVESIVNGVYRHFYYYYPEIRLPETIFTCVSGVNPDIPPVMLLEDALVISLDWYLDNDEVYNQIGVPQYRSERTGIAFLAKDLSSQIYQYFIEEGHKQTNLLEEMVYSGKKLFFVEAMCPSIEDRVLLGYTETQMEWAEEYEGNLWADLVGNRYLYSSEYEMFRVFFADGPFTNEYSHDAPARLGEFLELHMVRSYMDNHDCSLQDLMQNIDLQGIFQDSKYKPKK